MIRSLVKGHLHKFDKNIFYLLMISKGKNAANVLHKILRCSTYFLVLASQNYQKWPLQSKLMICHFQNGSNYQKLNILLERLGRFKLNPKISKILQNASKTYSSATSYFQVHSLPKMLRRDFTQKSHFLKIFSLLHEQLYITVFWQI